MAEFIGIGSLKEIANRISTQVIMGPAYSSFSEMDRLGIKITSGIQFKDTQLVMSRKGGTTRRKVAGQEVANKVGYLEERPLIAKLSWNRYYGNVDSFIETAIPCSGEIGYTYPESEAAMTAILANYAEDLSLNLWWGDINRTDERSLYDGFHTLRNKEIAAGKISKLVGNLIECERIDTNPANLSKTQWQIWCVFFAKLPIALKKAPKVLVYMSSALGAALAASYAETRNNNATVTYEMGSDGRPTGNFYVPEFKNVVFAPFDDFGVGDKMIVTIPQNFEYGVNTEDARSHVTVQIGSDKDANDVICQIQSVQGTRLLLIMPNSYVESNGTLTETIPQAGDYMKDSYTVSVSDEAAGSVTVDGADPDNTKEYPNGTTLALVATAKTGYDFVAWSDGVTTASRNVVTNGNPGGVLAIFKAHVGA